MSTLSPSEFREEFFSGSEVLRKIGARLSDQDILALEKRWT